MAAGADDGVIAVGKRGTGDGPLYASIPGREPIAAQARQEIGAVEATALGGGGGTWLRIKNVTIIGPTLSKALGVTLTGAYDISILPQASCCATNYVFKLTILFCNIYI